MKNMIRIQDLVAYFTERREVHATTVLEQQYQRTIAAAEYAKTIRARWFGCKFERSSVGHLDWLHTRWSHLIWSQDALRACNDAITKCVYHAKCGQNEMHWDFDEFAEQKFYVWCEKNGIPC